MNLTRIKTTMMAGMLAASMLMPGMTAMAATEQSETVPTINKTVDAVDGVTIPTADQSITFKIEQIANADGITAPGSITLDDSGVKTITASGKGDYTVNVLSAAEIAQLKTGEYTFSVTETKTASTTSFGWVVTDSTTYNMQVLKDKDGEVTYTVYDPADTTTKKDLNFSNTYNKKSENTDGTAYTLTVSKTVVNAEYVDADQTYPITITITAPAQQQSIGDDSYTVKDGVSREVEGKTVTIQAAIKNGESIEVSNLAVGATYQVSEDTSDLGANWKSVAYSSANESAATMGEADASVTVTNTYNKVTVTGVVTSIAPYVTLVVLAVAAVAAYMAMKSRVAR